MLFDLAADPTEIHDIAAKHPDLVADLAARWREDAWHNTVFPLPDGPDFFAHVPSTAAELSRPVTIRPGTATLERWRSGRLTDRRSFTVTARFNGGELGNGVIVSQGDQGGGYILFADNGMLCFSYNAYGAMRRREVSVAQVEAIVLDVQVHPDFTVTVRVDVDGAEVFTLTGLPALVGMAPFTGISVGFDGGGPVDWELHERHGRFPHSGSLRDVRYVPGAPAAFNDEIVVAVGEHRARLID
jgi:arylsulfatase